MNFISAKTKILILTRKNSKFYYFYCQLAQLQVKNIQLIPNLNSIRGAGKKALEVKWD